MRQVLGAVYTVRTKETIFSTRYENTVEYEKQKKQLAEGLKQIHLKGWFSYSLIILTMP